MLSVREFGVMLLFFSLSPLLQNSVPLCSDTYWSDNNRAPIYNTWSTLTWKSKGLILIYAFGLLSPIILIIN